MSREGQKAFGKEAPAEDVTGLLLAWRDGDSDALEKLIPLVYSELHRLAEIHLRRERAGHTLQPTAVIHEAYLRLVRGKVEWQNRAHFFAVAAQTMRRILVDHVRTREAKKRGGGNTRALFVTAGITEQRDVDVLDLDEALTKLAAVDPDRATVVELRFFGGLTIAQTAEALGQSPATVKRDWNFARAFLHRELTAGSR
jgi:RNA polymerase sigma-70 factor (ECF subfamily)